MNKKIPAYIGIAMLGNSLLTSPLAVAATTVNDEERAEMKSDTSSPSDNTTQNTQILNDSNEKRI